MGGGCQSVWTLLSGSALGLEQGARLARPGGAGRGTRTAWGFARDFMRDGRPGGRGLLTRPRLQGPLVQPRAAHGHSRAGFRSIGVVAGGPLQE